MKFSSLRLVTQNLQELLGFYERLTHAAAARLADGFAEFRLPGGAVLAISVEKLIQQFNAGAATAASNRSAIIEFEVDDVDVVHARMASSAPVVMAPTVMPWGNRSLLLRDPDGNLVNVFSRPKD